MRALAEAMWEAREGSTPRALQPGEWHLPFVTDEDRLAVDQVHVSMKTKANALKKISVARCARVSYESFETGRRSTVEEDLPLYEKLRTSGHWSPFEHQATPDDWRPNPAHNPSAAEIKCARGYVGTSWNNTLIWNHGHEHGNLVGWRQLRKTMPGEACAPMSGAAP